MQERLRRWHAACRLKGAIRVAVAVERLGEGDASLHGQLLVSSPVRRLVRSTVRVRRGMAAPAKCQAGRVAVTDITLYGMCGCNRYVAVIDTR